MLRAFSNLLKNGFELLISLSRDTQEDDPVLDDDFGMEGIPTFYISYTMNDDGACVIDFHAVRDNFDPENLASFVTFITSDLGITSTLQTIQQGTESIVGEDAHKAFFKHFIKQQDEARLMDEDGPFIDPEDVM